MGFGKDLVQVQKQSADRMRKDEVNWTEKREHLREEFKFSWESKLQAGVDGLHSPK